jgi:hypothetical protein
LSDRIANKIPISGLLRGEGGMFSSLPAPIPVSPINGQRLPLPRKLTLVWNSVTGATGYTVTVQWYSNTPQGKTWLTKPPVTTTSTSLTVDFPACSPGRWCVRVEDANGWKRASVDSQWSDFDFTIQILETPTLISPVNGQIFSNYPRKTMLTWRAVANATGYVVTVDACRDRQVSSTSIWQSVLPKTIVQATSFTFDFAGASPGRWCVFAINSANAYQQSALAHGTTSHTQFNASHLPLTLLGSGTG